MVEDCETPVLFSDALLGLLHGFRASRNAWFDTTNLYVVLKPGELPGAINDALTGQKAKPMSRFDLYRDTGQVVVGWLPTAEDLLATDWIVLDD